MFKGILFSLVSGIWYQDFIHNTPFLELLPPNSLFLSHPFTFFARYAEVYNMHVQYISSVTAEKRKQKVDDIAKRSEYRRAHGLEAPLGLEDEGEEGFGGWTARGERGRLVPESAGLSSPVAVGVGEKVVGAGKEVFVDFEGKEQVVPRKWPRLW